VLALADDPTIKKPDRQASSTIPDDAAALYRRRTGLLPARAPTTLAIRTSTIRCGVNPKDVEAFNNTVCWARNGDRRPAGRAEGLQRSLRVLRPNFVDEPST